MAKRGRKPGVGNKTIEYVSLDDLVAYGATLVPVRVQFAKEMQAALNWKRGIVTVESNDEDESIETQSSNELELETFDDDEDEDDNDA